MNKFLTLGLIAGAGALMAGCAKDAANSDFGQNAIEFGTYLGRNAQTKGALTTDNLANMGVYASYTNKDNFSSSSVPNFMYNQEVTKSESAWTYSPVKYWPTTVGDKISFFAYAPYADGTIVKTNSENSASGAPTLTVTLPSDLKNNNMVDFVAGVQMNKTHDNTVPANNEVKFALKHELSRVGIYAKVNEAVYGNDAANKTFVVIKSVKLDKAPASGQFYGSAKYTFSTDNDERGKWSDFSGAASDFDLDGVLNNTETITAEGAKSGSYKDGVKGVKLTGTTQVSLFKANEYLFLIPVADTESTESPKPAVNATATISYDIVTEDSNLDAGYSCTSATKTVSLPAGTLVQGKAYNYVFTINVNKVELSATLDSWSDATSADVSVDYSDTDVTA